ncbi:hypothetical protein glysoja_041492 [Glycine soja]|uniref:SIS domain-containing protein n=1 Tax=Glycine soja TaxID=3848 RepID=A0A0B2R3S4_GLYSO|nr:hypothetical protein glysoja_041492 [Glycine soja]
MHPNSFHILKAHPSIPGPTGPFSHRTHLRCLSKRQRFSIRRGPRGPHAQGPLHAPLPPGPLGPLCLRHDHSPHRRCRPPHRLRRPRRLLHRRCPLRGGALQRRKGAGDLLIASAGPGGFSTVDALCAVARSNGGRVLLLTAQPETGSCVKHANAVAYVAAQTMADDADAERDAKSRPLLPMGSVYEGALFVLFEMVVYKLGEALGESPEAVRSRHTNLE